MVNRLTKTIQSVDKYPSWLRSNLLDYFIGKTVKLTDTAGIHYQKMTSQEVIVELKNRRKV
jgi:hypothetical protein